MSLLRLILLVSYIGCLPLAHLSATGEDSCGTYNHPQYGFGQCIDRSQCANTLYQPGLCETRPANIQCCFSLNPLQQEFRAVWVATVTNIDWPSSRTDTVAKQQTDLMDMLNTVQQLNMNAIVFQVTRQSD
jgi:uncharacterized lipoprotein YddW (UPF0748 family)